MPEVSVIIPLYNKGKYIARALDSVFAQTHQDYEVIVVDDGSTDDGPEIVRRYTDPRLHIIHQDNAGPGAARNRGIRESRALFLAFLDADDEWMSMFLQKALSALKDNPDCDLAVSAWYQDHTPSAPYERDKPVDMSRIFREFGICEGGWRLAKDATDEELKHMLDIFYTGTVLCKREVIGKYCGFYSKANYTYGEDHFLWLELAFNHKVYRIMEPLAWYHNDVSELARGGSKSRPLEAFMIDPELIRKNCPPDYRDLLERWFAQYALRHAHIRSSCGKIEDARYFSEAFPVMRTWRWEYAKLKFKLMFPILIPFFRGLKRCLPRK